MNTKHDRNGYPRIITSRTNPLIVSAASLSEKKYRDKAGRFSFEGIKLYKEAIASKVCLEHVFVREDVYERFSDQFSPEISVVVPDFVYDKMVRRKISGRNIMCSKIY